MHISQQWFIYYRIRADDQAPVIHAVRAFQALLCERWPGLRAQVLRRTDLQNEMLTLMETYDLSLDPAAAGLDAGMSRLRGEIDQAATALTPWLQSARHTEEFVPCV
ncbi:DUF4936 family protein [Ideonella paludis]|uniref:DUF4936 family protein n=1 Tax=Ideonella paludis TaxID=1233411 RepID=A0ABS5DU79_9BURK|nr:DUF4936 family protein [Ideonella paludis]MBQ0934693.1 DUF4936 family protein [Ideonella paludis]